MPTDVLHPVASVYAETLAALGAEQGCLADFEEQMALLAGALDGMPELRAFLETPVLSAAVKAAFLEKAFGAGLHRLLLNFMQVVVRKGRAPFLRDICRAFGHELDRRCHRRRVRVSTAVVMTEATRAHVRAALAEALGGEIVLEETVTPALLGGVAVQYGDEFMDGSLRARLGAIRARLLRSRIHEIPH